MNNRNTTKKSTIAFVESSSLPNSPRNKQNSVDLLENLVSSQTKPQNLKNLYQNIGTRVSKLREVNENYLNKIKNQEAELNSIREQIEIKRSILDEEIRGKGKGKANIKLHDSAWVNQAYEEMLLNKEIDRKININHMKHDPILKKIYQEKESDLSILQNQLNGLNKKLAQIKFEINTLRLDNHKHQNNLSQLSEKKEKQNRKMNQISEDANRFLKEKGGINQELQQLSDKIESNKKEHENKIENLTKMIENTKKIKEFHENLAIEKFSSNTYRKTNYFNNSAKSGSKLSEYKSKLKEVKEDLETRKRITVHYNFTKLILLKKQNELNEIIDTIKSDTGIDNLNKLSSDLQLSTKINKLFENDLETLEEEKKKIETDIEVLEKEVEQADCILNDTTTIKSEQNKKMTEEVQKENEIKINSEKKLLALNKMIDLISKGLTDTCGKLSFFKNTLKFEGHVIV